MRATVAGNKIQVVNDCISNKSRLPLPETKTRMTMDIESLAITLTDGAL